MGDWSTWDSFSFIVFETEGWCRGFIASDIDGRSNREPQRLEPHLATEMGISYFGSTSGGSYLARGQVEDLGEMSRSRYSW
jgi:hypothetical protein